MSKTLCLAFLIGAVACAIAGSGPAVAACVILAFVTALA